MDRFFGRTKRDAEQPDVAVDPECSAELRRLAHLFLVSGVAMVLFLARAFAEMLSVTFIPPRAMVVWGIVMLACWGITYVYGLYVTFGARRWGWFAIVVIPVTCVPAALAYAWLRRQQIEREVLGVAEITAARQKRGGRKRN